ncbi:MAG: glycosyltransferase family 1 protein [Intestinibacter sp.]
MIGSLDIGGSQTMIMNIYRKIDRKKIQFDFILDHSEQLYFADEVKKLGGKIYFLPTFTGKNILQVRKAWKQFFIEHREYKILHSHVRSYASIFLPIAKKQGLYIIIHSHSTSNGRGIFSIIKKVMQYPLRYQADYYMACSNSAGKWLYGSKVTKGQNYKVIPNSIDAKKFDYNLDVRNKVRKELNLEDKFVIGHVGRMSTPKNHMFLIKVFAEVTKVRDDAVLLLIGDGNLRESIDKLIKEKGIANKVICLGSRNNVQDFYQAMDLFVFPSLWEGLGIVAIEAQTAGLPCFVSERVPKEIDLGKGLVYVLNLSDGEKTWAEEISNFKIKRRIGLLKEIKKMGYDIFENAQNLQKFYLQIDSKNEG